MNFNYTHFFVNGCNIVFDDNDDSDYEDENNENTLNMANYLSDECVNEIKRILNNWDKRQIRLLVRTINKYINE